MSTAAKTDARVESMNPGFEDVFLEHCDFVFGTAYSISNKREDAEDVVQTVFMRLLRRGFPPDFHKNPSAYLYRAAINESLNILRTQKRRPTIKLEGVDVPATVSASTSGEITQRKVYEAIGALNPKDAEVVILRYAHDYSDAEIAELLGKSRVNIAVRLHRARAQLKNLLRTSLGEKP